MSEWLQLQASDGNALSAYMARPRGQVRGGLVVIQEIFGVNSHIRSLVDGYAEQGYVAIAPALFDRIQPNTELNYSGGDLQKAFALYGELNPEKAILDVAAAFQRVSSEGAGAGVLGFCFGGLMAWLSATRGSSVGFSPRCAVGYYAGGIGKVAGEQPTCPVMLHFGAEDSHIGMDQVQAVKQSHPEVEVFVYEAAGHAFTRSVDPKSFNQQAAALAQQRTLEFLAQNIG